MANYQRLIPFLLQWEGRLSKNPNDKASIDPVPDGKGYHTNKGVTWTTFKSMSISCGYIATSTLFYQMPSDVWGKIMKIGYWDKFQGDKIQSQAIADTMLNWAFMSGVKEVVLEVQRLLTLPGPDGVLGPITLAAINSKSNLDDRAFSNDLLAMNKVFFASLKGEEAFEAGWLNRLNALHLITDPETLNHPTQLFPPQTA